MIGHILERALLHFVSSTFLVIASFIALRYWYRTNRKAALWLGTERASLVIAALGVFAIAALREPYDVWAGGPVVKSYTDFFSWFTGCAVSAWGVYRLRFK
jgi:hypothetical protein